MVSIKGIDKPTLLICLYGRAKAQGMGVVHYTSALLKYAEAEALIAASPYFDYLQGRVMKVKLEGDELDEELYDRNNGAGAALEAIDVARSMTDIDAFVQARDAHGVKLTREDRQRVQQVLGEAQLMFIRWQLATEQAIRTELAEGDFWKEAREAIHEQQRN